MAGTIELFAVARLISFAGVQKKKNSLQSMQYIDMMEEFCSYAEKKETKLI